MQRISTMFDVFVLAAAMVLNIVDGQLPDQIAKQVEARYAKMQVVSVEQDVEDGAIVYEVKVRDDARLIEAEFDADGNFLSSEEDVRWANVPVVVKTPFAKSYAQVAPVEITCHTRSHLGKEVVTYVIEFRANGQEREMGVSADGKVLFDRVD